MDEIEQSEYFDIEFGFKEGRTPMAFGPFKTEADAKREVARILSDNPHAFDGGYRITPKRGVPKPVAR